MNLISLKGTLLGSPSVGKRQGTVVLSIAIIAVMLVGVLRLGMPELLQIWEGATYDLRMQWRGAGPITDHLVIIGRDSKSDEEFGVGIWNRAIFADLIAALDRAGARTIALDFHFGGVSPFGRGGTASDQRLIDAVGSAGTVLLPLPVAFAGETRSWSPELLARLAGHGSFVDPMELPHLPHVNQVIPPLPGLVLVAKGFGHIGALSDSDGVYRRVPTFVSSDRITLPAMGVVIAASFLQVPSDSIRLTPDHTLEFKGAQFPDGTQHDFSVPVDGQGNLLIDYVGRWEDGAIPYFPFLDVWKKLKEPGGEAELRQQVAGKAVLIMQATVEADKRRTPFDLTAPGGFIVANTFGTILTGGHLRAIPEWGQWGIVMVMALAATWMVLALPFARGGTAAGGLGVLYLIGVFEGFKIFGVVLPVLSPMVGLLVATGGTLVWVSGFSMAKVQKVVEQIQEAERHRLAVQRELIESQRLLAERQVYVRQLEEQMATSSAHATIESDPVAHVRNTLVVELRHAQEELSAREASIKRLRESLDQAVQVREHLELELRQAREGEAKWRHAATRVQTQESSARVTAMGLNTFPTIAALELEELKKECNGHPHLIITSDPTLLGEWKKLRKVAKSLRPVLILGETGTGKELFARAVHSLSKRPGLFVARNMTELAPGLFESELFGHVKGAFIGADRVRKGMFVQADNGTVFLDEIGDLGLDLQVKLLRVLQEGVLTPVGADKEVKVDVRVVAATNRDLMQEIARGKFREDLYYRLQGVELRLPSLRERPDDIPMLAKYFVDAEGRDNNYPSMTISEEALHCLRSWPWKGNVRELQQCLRTAVINAESSEILPHDLGVVGVPAVAPIPSTVSADSCEFEEETKISDTRVATTATRVISEIPPFVLSNGTDDPRTNDEVFLRKIRECHFSVNKAITILKWDRSTITHRLKGLCFQALVHTNRNMEEAASALAGGDSVLKRLAQEKVQEYLDNLEKVIEGFPSREDAVTGCQDRFKNLPKRYHKALASLVRLSFSQSPSLPLS